ncbi:MAG: recombination mediator RecR [bacterium]|nr:recombination mediator RecR [bacterium]
MLPESIKKLNGIFSKFPTIGARTAARFSFYLLSLSENEIEELISAIKNLRQNVRFCKFCFKPFESNGDFCEICGNYKAREPILCVIESETDLMAIENPKIYKGLYFVLGGTVSHLKKEDFKKIRVSELLERLENSLSFGLDIKFEEIILANNLTTEGESTTLYLEEKLKPLGIKISHLARGLPNGAELEYTDEETLGAALEGRK